MFEARKWYSSVRIERTVESLKKKGFDAVLVENIDEAVNKVLEMVPENALVGLGGSVTLREMNLPNLLRERGNQVADHWEARKQKSSPEEVMAIRRQHLNSDAFITSTNALTEGGELVNIDGSGQRVAAMIFGPKKVIIITGVNKIVKDLDEAIWRARNVASPINAKRLNLKTPCVHDGVCLDCETDDRICNVTTIIHKRLHNTDTTIILVNQELGY